MTADTSAQAGPLEILLVEDDDVHATLVQRFMKRNGVHCQMTRQVDVPSALAFLEEAPQIQLVLLDLNLPGYDGFHLLAQMKEQVKWRTIPVIILSSSFSPHDGKKAKAMGAAAYFEKPLEAEPFLALLDQLPLAAPRERA